MSSKASSKQLELIQALETIARDKKFNRMSYCKPYPRQKEFFNFGSTKRERLLMAPNRVGKTEGGAMEMAWHLTGEYPEWWTGKRFARPVRAWAVGETGVKTRDTVQVKLCGAYGLDSELGSGYLPRSAIRGKPSLSRGVTDAFDTIHITHKTNGIEDGPSILSFKSYDQGPTKFEGTTMDVVWLDEEPPQSVFTECLVRISPSTEEPEGGIIYMTFTPTKGMSSVVKEYIYKESPDRIVVRMSIEDSGNWNPKSAKVFFDSLQAHERKARYYGEPAQGEGAVFQVTQEAITEDAIPLEAVPANWVKLWGIDFGIAHPFAAILIAWDRDYDVIHVLHAFKVKDQLPISHAFNINNIAANVPIAWPHDGAAREASTGDQLIKAYKIHLPNVLSEHATHPEGGYSTEAGILELSARMTTERFKVNKNLVEWFKEFNSYYRKDGLITKEDDDLMSATRIAVMMRRKARAIPLGNIKRRQTTNKEFNSDEAIAARIDYPLF